MKKKISVILMVLLIMSFAITSIGLTTIPVTGIRLNTSSISLQTGKTYTLKVTLTPNNATNKKLTFSSANKKIASVDKNGKIKGITAGKTVITVTSSSNKKAVAKCNVIVTLARKIEISYVSNACKDIEPDNWAQKKVEAALNIKLVTRKIDIYNSEQVKLMLASGDMPDCGWVMGNPIELYDQGLTRTIPKDMVEQYMPNYTKMLNRYPVSWKLYEKKDKKDELLALTGMYDMNSDLYTFAPYFRLDWLEKLGIKPNGKIIRVGSENNRLYLATEPFTQEQLNNIFKLFTKNDPDKNGKNDTFGIIGSKYQNYAWMDIMGMFGIQDGYFPVEDNGKTVASIACSRYKDFLKYIRSLYKNGYIDPESATLDWDPWNERLAMGKGGYFQSDAFYAMEEAFPDRAPNLILKKNPEAKILIAPASKGNSGYQGTRVPNEIPYTYNFQINKNVNNEKLIRILQMIEFCYFDKDASFYLVFGEEGVHFNWTGKPGESAPKLIDGVKTGGTTGLSTYRNHYITTREFQELQILPANREYFRIVTGDWVDKYVIHRYRVDFKNETRVNEYSRQYGATLQTIIDEYFYKALAGEIDIDSSWDDYLKKLDAAGLDKITQEINKMPLLKDALK